MGPCTLKVQSCTTSEFQFILFLLPPSSIHALPSLPLLHVQALFLHDPMLLRMSSYPPGPPSIHYLLSTYTAQIAEGAGETRDSPSIMAARKLPWFSHVVHLRLLPATDPTPFPRCNTCASRYTHVVNAAESLSEVLHSLV
ncbi:hypothetical protein C8R44DRAFT_728170 [Mycena epipterygia]|nr:hypothetical protein C8R44DRAFT_728170 [Mycena epipterygia]